MGTLEKLALEESRDRLVKILRKFCDEIGEIPTGYNFPGIPRTINLAEQFPKFAQAIESEEYAEKVTTIDRFIKEIYSLRERRPSVESMRV